MIRSAFRRLVNQRSLISLPVPFRRRVTVRVPIAGLMSTAGLCMHAACASDTKPRPANTKPVNKKVLKEADKLFDDGLYWPLVALLQKQEDWDSDPESLWRVARGQFHMLKIKADTKDASLQQALDNVLKAIELNSECGPAQKWAAILVDAAAAAKGTRARIESLLIVKGHMEQAVRLMPSDGTAHYLLGEWHYSLCTTGWAARRIAAVVFATLPEASFEQALQSFETAERVEPGFYSKNLLLRAKTLIALGRKSEAEEPLRHVIQRFSSSDKWDDREAVTEAAAILKTMGITV